MSVTPTLLLKGIKLNFAARSRKIRGAYTALAQRLLLQTFFCSRASSGKGLAVKDVVVPAMPKHTLCLGKTEAQVSPSLTLIQQFRG